MAEQFGSLAYFERLDAYLPDKPSAEDPDRVWHSDKSVAENVKSGAVKKKKPKMARRSRKKKPATCTR